MPPRKSTQKTETGSEPSIYQILNKWLYDGSRSTEIPEEVLESKNAFSQLILLNTFQASQYIIYLSEHFNNYYLYTMERSDILRFLKDCLIRSGYKPRFLSKDKHEKTQISKILKTKYPFLKKYEITYLTNVIDTCEDKDQIYETLGLRRIKKEKTTKSDLKDFHDSLNYNRFSLQDLLSNFK